MGVVGRWPKVVLSGVAVGLVVGLAAGCSSGVSTSPTVGRVSASPAPGTGSATTSAPSPTQECVSAIAYWAVQALTPGADQGYDYQEMGLSAGEYKILLDLTARARPIAKQSGADAAQAFVRREALPRCAAYVATHSASASSAGPGWPQ